MSNTISLLVTIYILHSWEWLCLSMSLSLITNDIPVFAQHQQQQKLEGQCCQLLLSVYSLKEEERKSSSISKDLYSWALIDNKDSFKQMNFFMHICVRTNISCWFLHVTTILGCPFCSHCLKRDRLLQKILDYTGWNNIYKLTHIMIAKKFR